MSDGADAPALLATMIDAPDENPAKRRKVRKGTHSCRECRRRKVRCIFASPEDTACIICQKRGSECISQVNGDEPGFILRDVHFDRETLKSATVHEYGDGQHYNLANHVTVSRMHHQSLSNSGITTSAIPTNHHEGPEYDVQPLGSYQASNTLPTPVPSQTSVSGIEKHTEVMQTLLGALPCQQDTKLLISKVGSSSSMRCYSSHRIRGQKTGNEPKRQTPRKDLLQPEKHPVLLARQMLDFAASLQSLSPKESIPQLSIHHHTIMLKLAGVAIKEVTTNDALLGSLEGLEIVILEALYHIDCGNIRRGWVTLRRAVTIAQLLGLHWKGHHRFKCIDESDDLDPDAMWISIVCMERMVSLLLGLPTSTLAVDIAMYGSTSVTVRECKLPTALACLMAKIMERNQITAPQEALEMTDSIDRELISFSEGAPQQFWSPINYAGLRVGSVEALDEFQRTLDQVCYYTLVIQLHLPYMLCPDQRIYSKIACVNASREILTREIALRTFDPVSACSRMADFMALIGGMTLMLAHAVSHCGKSTNNLLAHARLGDRAMVERALECMESMFQMNEDALAVKCAAMLQNLLAIEVEAAAAARMEGEHDGEGSKMVIIRVPFIGGISFSKNGVATIAISTIEQDQGLSDGVIIGGIGAISIDHTKAPKRGVSKPVADITVPRATPSFMSIANEPLLPSLPAQETPESQALQQDPMFPDAAAILDDWWLQGLDTAFFETLMRGAGDR
ncbi:hypothetical protein BAUCODRAFT_98616, partial [Baudoinia panamericana UAMH 10762]